MRPVYRYIYSVRRCGRAISGLRNNLLALINRNVSPAGAVISGPRKAKPVSPKVSLSERFFERVCIYVPKSSKAYNKWGLSSVVERLLSDLIRSA
jgi:hypothetical protein